MNDDQKNNNFYFLGNIALIEQNLEKAGSYFRKGAHLGCIKCQYALGVMRHKNLIEGTENGLALLKSAYTPLQRLAEKDDAALLLCAFYNQFGFVSPQKLDLAKKQMLFSALHGYWYAQYKLALEFFKGGLFAKDYKEGEKWLLLSAEAIPVLQWVVACFYSEGKYLPKNPQQAFVWMQRASKIGYAQAYLPLASFYLNGTGCALDKTQGTFWLRKSAESGNENAQRILQQVDALEEHPVLQQQRMLNEIFQHTTPSENPFADFSKLQANISALKQANPFFGKLLAETEQKAFFDFGKAMHAMATTDEQKQQAFLAMQGAKDLGNTEADLTLAQDYYYGTGVEQDYAQAIKLFQSATRNIEQKGEACFYLGNCYAFGLFYPKDEAKAREYYQTAIEFGFDCKTALDALDYSHRAIPVNSVRYYAEGLINKMAQKQWEQQIRGDLVADFKEDWDKLLPLTQTELTSGITFYTLLLSLGNPEAEGRDFSPAIIALSKAIEQELGQFFFKGYLEYLQGRRIPFSTVYGLRRFEKSNDGKKQYPDSNQTQLFTLGALRHILEIGKHNLHSEAVPIGDGEATISKLVVDYALTAFKDEVFAGEKRRECVARYLIEFANELLLITEYRNFAAHSRIMSCSEAELCADCILHIKKLLYNFISKKE